MLSAEQLPATSLHHALLDAVLAFSTSIQPDPARYVAVADKQSVLVFRLFGCIFIIGLSRASRPGLEQTQRRFHNLITLTVLGAGHAYDICPTNFPDPGKLQHACTG